MWIFGSSGSPSATAATTNAASDMMTTLRHIACRRSLHQNLRHRRLERHELASRTYRSFDVDRELEPALTEEDVVAEDRHRVGGTRLDHDGRSIGGTDVADARKA